MYIFIYVLYIYIYIYIYICVFLRCILKKHIFSGIFVIVFNFIRFVAFSSWKVTHSLQA